jgi:Ca2+-binding RTX toxin-like protein
MGGMIRILAGVDADTVLGGASNDLITNVGDTSPDILYGDQGYWNATTISNVTDPHDGDDQIFSEGGNDIILRGGGKDSLESSLGLDIVLGDHGIVTRNTTEVIRIETRESDSGDNDTILAGNDDDTVFGGPKDDLITGDTSNNGDDILIGDQGYWTPEVIVAHFDSTSNVDGADTITGNGGNDTLLGNNNRDYLRGNQGLDIIIGDYGIINHTGKVAQRIDTQEVTLGHDDFINGDENNDTLLGGTASDSIQGGADAGRDIIIGDNGTVVNNDGTAQSNEYL